MTTSRGGILGRSKRRPRAVTTWLPSRPRKGNDTGGQGGAPQTLLEQFPAHPLRRAEILYPRFVRALNPEEGSIFLEPDPITGLWPRLNPAAVASPAGIRRPIDCNRPPSKRAYAEWCRESLP